MSKAKTITAERLDQLVDEDKEDVLQYFDLENARRGGAGTKRINIDMPVEFLAELDREAGKRGITRQSLIKVWLYDRLHGSEPKKTIFSLLKEEENSVQDYLAAFKNLKAQESARLERRHQRLIE